VSNDVLAGKKKKKTGVGLNETLRFPRRPAQFCIAERAAICPIPTAPFKNKKNKQDKNEERRRKRTRKLRNLVRVLIALMWSNHNPRTKVEETGKNCFKTKHKG
jgi:hypothetical protein